MIHIPTPAAIFKGAGDGSIFGKLTTRKACTIMRRSRLRALAPDQPSETPAGGLRILVARNVIRIVSK
jgi:hypothetical protein